MEHVMHLTYVVAIVGSFFLIDLLFRNNYDLGNIFKDEEEL